MDQQGDVDWELVLVDDGSTDASTTIARDWAAHDPGRIRYVEHPGHANLGMSASRNAGVAAARGCYIGFLDCDDVWLPSALAHGLRVFARHPDADVVVGGTWRWHGWTGEQADVAQDHRMSLPDAPPHTVVAPPRLIAGMYGQPGAWRIPAMCSLLVERAALARIGGLDDRFRNLYEDQVLYAKIAARLRVVVDPRPMALYRQHPESACQVAIDAGEWRRLEPNAHERHYVDWMHAYVLEATGADAEAMAVVARNVEHAARGEHVARPPGGGSSGLRRHLPEPLRRGLRMLRRRVRRDAPPPSVLEVWSEQFLAPVVATWTGRTLVVEDRPRGGPWVASPPARAIAGAVTRGSLARAAAEPASYDQILVPHRAAAALATTELMGALVHVLGPHGSAAAMIPGPAREAGRPGAADLVALVRRSLPGHDVVVESFGNDATRGAVATGAAAATLGTLVDRHDPAVPVAFGVLITRRDAPFPPEPDDD